MIIVNNVKEDIMMMDIEEIVIEIEIEMIINLEEEEADIEEIEIEIDHQDTVIVKKMNPNMNLKGMQEAAILFRNLLQ